jgi:hypothetical protein
LKSKAGTVAATTKKPRGRRTAPVKGGGTIIDNGVVATRDAVGLLVGLLGKDGAKRVLSEVVDGM